LRAVAKQTFDDYRNMIRNSSRKRPWRRRVASAIVLSIGLVGVFAGPASAAAPDTSYGRPAVNVPCDKNWLGILNCDKREFVADQEFKVIYPGAHNTAYDRDRAAATIGALYGTALRSAQQESLNTVLDRIRTNRVPARGYKCLANETHQFAYQVAVQKGVTKDIKGMFSKAEKAVGLGSKYVPASKWLKTYLKGAQSAADAMLSAALKERAAGGITYAANFCLTGTQSY